MVESWMHFPFLWFLPRFIENFHPLVEETIQETSVSLPSWTRLFAIEDIHQMFTDAPMKVHIFANHYP